MAQATSSPRSTGGVRGLAEQANPAFAAGAVAIPVLALVAALTVGDLRTLTYVHVMAGALWTGIDLFIGMVVGPVAGGMTLDQRAGFFRRFTPKMTFLMPVLAAVTISGGVVLALELGKFPHADPWLAMMTAAILVPVVLLVGWQFDALTHPRTLVALGIVLVVSGSYLALTVSSFVMTDTWIVAALGIVTLLSVIGFGVILPGEVRIYRQIVSEDPDDEIIGTIGMRNARLGGVQGLLQLTIIFVMVNLRF
jgi:predicted neutral ceramidase superfamily lipid hydrolase